MEMSCHYCEEKINDIEDLVIFSSGCGCSRQLAHKACYEEYLEKIGEET